MANSLLKSIPRMSQRNCSLLRLVSQAGITKLTPVAEAQTKKRVIFKNKPSSPAIHTEVQEQGTNPSSGLVKTGSELW